MKYIINDEFRFFLSSRIYLTFDLYVFKYIDVQPQTATIDIFNSFKNGTNISKYMNNSHGVRYSYMIDNLDTILNITSVQLAYKSYNKIYINDDRFKINVGSWCNHINCCFIKRFDDSNYIVPIMFYFDDIYLNSTIYNGDKYIDLRNMKELINSKYELIELTNKFNMLI